MTDDLLHASHVIVLIIMTTFLILIEREDFKSKSNPIRNMRSLLWIIYLSYWIDYIFLGFHVVIKSNFFIFLYSFSRKE